jgi:hypothetical protein
MVKVTVTVVPPGSWCRVTASATWSMIHKPVPVLTLPGGRVGAGFVLFRRAVVADLAVQRPAVCPQEQPPVAAAVTDRVGRQLVRGGDDVEPGEPGGDLGHALQGDGAGIGQHAGGVGDRPGAERVDERQGGHVDRDVAVETDRLGQGRASAAPRPGSRSRRRS